MDVQVSKYVRLRAKEAMPLIFGERGAGLFFQGTKLQGKLFVAAFGLDRDHTSWPIHQTFVPFLDLTLQAARAEDPTPTAFEPGELSMVQLPRPSVRSRCVNKGRRSPARPSSKAGRNFICRINRACTN
jgi:hypothetical protein